MGWDPVPAPALVLTSRPPGRLPAAQALLLPSRAAARALGGSPPDLPVFAVGEGTAKEARASGFRDVTAAEGEAASLTELAAERLDPARGPLLLAVGEGYSQALAAALRARGFRVIRRVVYAASPAESLPKAAHDAVSGGRVVAALFFSPRSASCAISLLQKAGLASAAARMDAFAISPRVGAALAPLPWRMIRAAPRPDPAALLELLGPCRASPEGSC